ncbi:MAG: cytochrome c biogenesis protein ResB [bacterium]|nr:cytochrome c biogenesis protein ResB [bacterium]
MIKLAFQRLSNLFKWFKKPKTTIYILVTLSFLYLLGLIIPQKIFFETKAAYDAWIGKSPLLFNFIDWIGFTDIYVAPFTLFLLTLFFINLLAVTIDRIPILLRRAYIGSDIKFPFDLKSLLRSSKVREINVEKGEEGAIKKSIENYFIRHRWHVKIKNEGNLILAVRNRFAVIGFLFFHISFLFFLAGALLIFYSRFSGLIVLTEGESFSGNISRFRKVNRMPKIMKDLSMPKITLEEVEMNYEGDRKTDLYINLDVEDGVGVRREWAGVNQPVVLGNVSLLAMNAGVSPLFILRRVDDNSEVDGAWLSLNVLDGNIDSFSFSNSSTITYTTWFYPDYQIEDMYESSKTPEIRNPAFHVVVQDKGTVLAEATIRKGQGMIFEPYILIFEEIRAWGELHLVREAGPPFLVAGFILAITGLFMRLIFYRREIRIALSDGKLYLAGSSDLHQFSFEEKVDKIKAELSTELMT